jgi:RNA polymerase sigma-70 factor, ECF subfamily
VYIQRVDLRLSETEAIASARRGDPAAYAVLVRAHQEVACRAAYLVVRDAHLAEDVTQEAFVRAYSQIGRFREGTPFRPWLLRIVTNLALNEARARRRRIGVLERFSRAWRPQDVPPPEEPLLASEEARSVWRAMEQLAAEDRIVLQMRYFLELSEKEMATALAKPPGTVKSRLHRAMGRLREVIERDFPELRDMET